MKIDMHNLPSDPELLKKMVTHLSKKCDRLTMELQSLKDQLTLLRKKRFGSSSEKLSTLEKEALDQQIDEIEQKLEDSDVAQSVDEQIIDTPKSQSRGKGKRTSFPKQLPREEPILEPDPVCPECQNKTFRKISDDVSEIIDYVPGHFKVIKYIRPRYACTACDTIVQALPPTRPLHKSTVGTGLLAHVLINKYCRSLPIYRQCQMFMDDHDIELHRSTVTGWVGRAAKELAPLVKKIQDYVFEATHVHSDDTVMKVLAPGLKKTKTGRLWVYASEADHHSSISRHPALCYFYSPDRKAIRPETHLKDFTGVLHADAYAGYNKVYQEQDVLEAACWAHTRRKFYEAAVVSGNASIASHVLEEIKKLYELEEQMKDDPPDQKKVQRQTHARPIIDALMPWMKKAQRKLPRNSPTAKAITYALNLEAALQRYLDDGNIKIDNNVAERALRIVAIGRKNFLFAGSDSGGDTAAHIYTLTETAKANHLSPQKYMAKILELLPDYNSQKIHELLPWNIKLE